MRPASRRHALGHWKVLSNNMLLNHNQVAVKASQLIREGFLLYQILISLPSIVYRFFYDVYEPFGLKSLFAGCGPGFSSSVNERQVVTSPCRMLPRQWQSLRSAGVGSSRKSRSLIPTLLTEAQKEAWWVCSVGTLCVVSLAALPLAPAAVALSPSSRGNPNPWMFWMCQQKAKIFAHFEFADTPFL